MLSSREIDMTAEKFRQMALALPEAVEKAHMGHPDFRVAGKIFATLWADDEHGMVKLTPIQQVRFVTDDPDVFEPVNGAWGRQGATKVTLRTATVPLLRKALVAAWYNIAPKQLARTAGPEEPT